VALLARSPFDGRLRAAVELVPATVLGALAAALLLRPEAVGPLLPGVARAVGATLLPLAAWRAGQGLRVLRYRARIRRLGRYVLRPARIPVSKRRLFLGRGFRWDQRHTQRLVEARLPEGRRWLEPPAAERAARRLERWLERRAWGRPLARLLAADAPWNPVRPLPPVGGDPALHGVGAEDEDEVWLDIAERQGHLFVVGTTRVGKTRLAELLVAQDIRRGEVTIVVDPKGDLALLERMVAEARRAGRLDRFHLLHLGYPEISERYNPVGSFARITEVATRTTTPLPGEGNSAAFKQFAWRFANVVAQALVGLGRKPDLKALGRYVSHIEPLLTDYLTLWLDRHGPQGWRRTVEAWLADPEAFRKTLPLPLRSKDLRAAALVRYYQELGRPDPVCDGLKSTFEYEKAYFDKLTASLLPLIEKLTSGAVGELLAPDYGDPADPRPVLDWLRVIREGGIVYVGLDALSDAEVAHAVGAAMLGDLTSIAGRIYKHGPEWGLPDGDPRPRTVNLHVDEFHELLSPEFIPMLNKAAGAGFRVTAYTQTVSDLEAALGGRALAGQAAGNLNSLIMLRVRNVETARLLTDQLPRVRIYTQITESRATDNNDPDTPVDFISQNADRVVEGENEMLRPADLVALPKGQAFALLHGGQLWKIRLPLLAPDPLMPRGVKEIAACLRRPGEG